jgi:hypothetical protein
MLPSEGKLILAVRRVLRGRAISGLQDDLLDLHRRMSECEARIRQIEEQKVQVEPFRSRREFGPFSK